MNILIGTAVVSLIFNFLCIKELRKKQDSRKKIKRSYRRAITALDKKDSKIRSLATDLVILKERTGIKNV